MKIANDVQHTVLSRLWQKMGHTVHTFQPDEKYDIIILHNLDSFLFISQHCENTKIILFPQGIPHPLWAQKSILCKMAEHPKVARVVFYHKLHKDAWEFTKECALIPPALDFDSYPQWTGTEKRIVTVGSNVGNIDWAFGTAIWQQAASGLPATLIGANNEDFGSVERGIVGVMEHKQFIEYMQSSLVYFNPILHLPISYPFLEALAIGMPVVSCINPLTIMMLNAYKGDIFGYFTPIVYQIRSLLKEAVLQDEDDFRKMAIDSGISERAKSVVRLLFSEQQFSMLWDKLFKEVL